MGYWPMHHPLIMRLTVNEKVLHEGACHKRQDIIYLLRSRQFLSCKRNVGQMDELTVWALLKVGEQLKKHQSNSKLHDLYPMGSTCSTKLKREDLRSLNHPNTLSFRTRLTVTGLRCVIYLELLVINKQPQQTSKQQSFFLRVRHAFYRSAVSV